MSKWRHWSGGRSLDALTFQRAFSPSQNLCKPLRNCEWSLFASPCNSWPLILLSRCNQRRLQSVPVLVTHPIYIKFQPFFKLHLVWRTETQLDLPSCSDTSCLLRRSLRAMALIRLFIFRQLMISETLHKNVSMNRATMSSGTFIHKKQPRMFEMPPRT